MKEELNSKRVDMERDLLLRERQMEIHEKQMEEDRKDKELQRAQTKETLDLFNVLAGRV